MVKLPRALRDFRDEQDGVSLTEGLLVYPIIILMFAALAEFGYAMSQWNQAVKALQVGARMAAVSSPVVDGFDPVAVSTPADNSQLGDSLPAGTAGPWACGPTTGTACNAGLARIVYGSAAATSCQPIGPGVKPAMCHLDPRIGTANVLVTYSLNGLGYWGRPGGAIVTIRMELRNVTLDLPVLGALIGINDQLTLPPMPVTITSEDLDSAYS